MHDGPAQSATARQRILYATTCGLLATFAFALTWITGHRGIFLLDQSMIFDGGWRVLQGQVPYKDFYIPFGPIAFYLQALLFRVAGVTWSASVLGACVLNVIATLIAIRIVRVLAGRNSRILACGAGFATAVCFQPPFGTLWFEQTALFFDFIALFAIVESLHRGERISRSLQFAAGTVVVVAFLSKQNFGGLFYPCIVALLIAGELPNLRSCLRGLAATAGGTIFGVGVFMVWLTTYSDPREFVHRAIQVAGEIGRSRISTYMVPGMLTLSSVPIMLQPVPNMYQIDAIGLPIGAIALLVAIFNFRSEIWRELAPPAVCAMFLPLFRSLTQQITFNDWENNMAFVGVATALSIALALTLLRHLYGSLAENTPIHFPPSGVTKAILFTTMAAWTSFLIMHELQIAWTRRVQEFAKGTDFTERVQVHGLEQVYWGTPTRIAGTLVTKRDFEAVARFIEHHPGRFFIMGDSTLFYGLFGVRPPQPLLYFLPSHSYSITEVPELDRRISAELESSNVQFVLREKVTHLAEVSKAYETFPKLWEWFRSSFKHTTDFGNYEVWERKGRS